MNDLQRKRDKERVKKYAKVSMNDWIKVRLTPHGAYIFYHQYDSFNKDMEKKKIRLRIEPKMPVIDKDGYTSFLLWNFIELYGPHIGIAEEPVCDVDNIIIPCEPSD